VIILIKNIIIKKEKLKIHPQKYRKSTDEGRFSAFLLKSAFIVKSFTVIR